MFQSRIPHLELRGEALEGTSVGRGWTAQPDSAAICISPVHRPFEQAPFIE
jgi:hypothetical protein